MEAKRDTDSNDKRSQLVLTFEAHTPSRLFASIAAAVARKLLARSSD